MAHDVGHPDRVPDEAWAEHKPPAVSLEPAKDGVQQIVVKGDLQRLAASLKHLAIFESLVSQVVSIGSSGKVTDDDAANFRLGYVDAMHPQDAAEALLLAQMAATHQAMMTMAKRLNHVESIPQQDSSEKAMNKLARTFTTQMEALKRYRSKGQQTVRVERVTVEEGGQAIVGNVETGGRGTDET